MASFAFTIWLCLLGLSLAGGANAASCTAQTAVAGIEPKYLAMIPEQYTSNSLLACTKAISIKVTSDCKATFSSVAEEPACSELTATGSYNETGKQFCGLSALPLCTQP